MRLTINLPSKHEERIRKAFDGEGTIEKQIEGLVLNHVGQKELNEKTIEADKKLKDKQDKLKAERDAALQKEARSISTQLGL
jgi:hypothetical protein